MNKLFVLGTVAVLSACSVDSLMATAYPDREIFAFRSTVSEEDVLRYACAPSATEEETLRRARAAHAFADAQLEAFAERAETRMIQRLESGDSTLAASFELNRNASRFGEVLSEEIEARYQCLLFDFVET
ncbi:hypothetical protein AADZ90_017080 [Aestuariibius sp. 2305UL40-4]|uniref:hypothetical protein n=1 Tax=Aestuariibius violaceus TaxID=3234132 RepID=UPI00345E5CC4